MSSCRWYSTQNYHDWDDWEQQVQDFHTVHIQSDTKSQW